jgi:hypothetical protein
MSFLDCFFFGQGFALPVMPSLTEWSRSSNALSL